MRLRFLAVWGSAVLLVGALPAAAIVAAQSDGGSSGPRVWIDDPLDGTAVPVGPIEIVAHATSPLGLAKVELNIDEVLVDEAGGGKGLVTARWMWTPPGPGTYRVTVRAVEGEPYTDSDPVTVFVGGAPDEVVPTTPTTVPADTTVPAATTVPTGTTVPGTATTAATAPPTATTSARTTAAPTLPPTTVKRTTTLPPTLPPTTDAPTTTECEVETPVPQYPTGGVTVDDRTPTLSWDLPGGGCAVGSFFVEVSRDAGFARTEVSGSTESESWTVPSGSPLDNCVTYYWHVRANTGRTTGAWSSVVSFHTDFGGC